MYVRCFELSLLYKLALVYKVDLTRTMKEIYKIDCKGSTVLHHLAYEGKIAISHMLIKLLLENNNSIIDIQDNNGHTALMIASSYNHNNPKMVKILLENNANISLRNKQGSTALMLASEYSRNSHNVKNIKLLLEYDGNPDNNHDAKYGFSNYVIDYLTSNIDILNTKA